MDKKIKDIAARIKDLREFSDYSLEEFASKVNVTVEDYKNIEDGVVDIPIGTMYNIAAALEIDPTVLLTGQNSDSKEVAICYAGQGLEDMTAIALAVLHINFLIVRWSQCL